MGDVFDSFAPQPGQDPQDAADEARDKIRTLCLVMVGLAVFVMITAALQNYLLMTASASVGANLRTIYL